MSVHDLRDGDEARRYIEQGIWLQQRLFPPSPLNLRSYLEWALEIASSGEPLPPIGFIADVGVEVFDMARGENRDRGTAPHAGLPPTLARNYEDHVLGKIYTDWTFERARDALKSYPPGRERARGLAFLISRFRDRAQFDGVILPPSIIRTMMEVAPEETQNRGLTSLNRDGLMPLLERCYQSMVNAARGCAEMLGEEDYKALENRIALAEESQRLAHKLAIQAKVELRDALPRHKFKSQAGRHEVQTRVLDEDTYPVGGFSSISTRGSVESLLHSQLAYMEPKTRPDLFDVKYIRDELYYYSRDENQFLRRRRSFVFALYPDLVQARFKDPELHYQRIVYLLGLFLASVERLTEWLSSDALRFDFVFLHDDGSFPLRHEYELLEMLFLKQIEDGTVHLYPVREQALGAPAATGNSSKSRADDRFARVHTQEELVELCKERSRRSLCHVLTLSIADRPLEIDEVPVSRLALNGSQPALGLNLQDGPVEMEWTKALENLVQRWV